MSSHRPGRGRTSHSNALIIGVLRRSVPVICLMSLVAAPAIARAAAPGTLDPSFGSGGAVGVAQGSQLFGIAVQANGEIVAAGQSGGKVLVSRWTTSGRADGTFVGPAGYARGVAIQADGKILVAGTSGGKLYAERLTAGLAPDSSFGAGGVATTLGSNAVANSVAVAPDGTIVAAGSINPPSTRVAVAAFTSQGGVKWSKTLDYGAFSVANGVAAQPDGKIVLVGSQTPSQATNGLLIRLNSDGNVDSSFNGGAFIYHFPGGGFTQLNAVTLQGDGKIVAAGIAYANDANALFLRLNPNGSFDTGFGNKGVRALPSAQAVSVPGDPIGAYGVGIAGGGRIVGAGNYEYTGAEVDAALFAVSSGGAPDSAFGGTGTFRQPRGNYENCGMAIAPDGSLLAVGDTVASFPDVSPCNVGTSTGYVLRYGGFGLPPGAAKPPVPSLSVSFAGVAGVYKIAFVVRHGLSVGVTCSQACRLSTSLVVSAGGARQLGIRTTIRHCRKVRRKTRCAKVHAYRPLTLASGSGGLKSAGHTIIVLRLKRQYVRALKRQRQIGVSVQLIATSTQTGKQQTLRRNLTFRR